MHLQQTAVQYLDTSCGVCVCVCVCDHITQSTADGHLPLQVRKWGRHRDAVSGEGSGRRAARVHVTGWELSRSEGGSVVDVCGVVCLSCVRVSRVWCVVSVSALYGQDHISPHEMQVRYIQLVGNIQLCEGDP